MTVLTANGGNIKKTSRETGISPKTLREWKAGGKDIPPPEKSEALTQSYLDKARRTREALLDRMAVLAASETDLFKVSGAFKIVAEAASEEEVNRALAARISNAQAQAAPGTEGPRGAGGGAPVVH